MIKQLQEKPGCFSEGYEGDLYFEVSDDSGPFAWACLNTHYAPFAILHFEIESLTHNRLKTLLKHWPYIKGIAREHGCMVISAEKEGALEEGSSWRKLCRHFGFEQFVIRTTALQGL